MSGRSLLNLRPSFQQKNKKDSVGLSNRRRNPSGSADIDRESLRVDGCFSQYLILRLRVDANKKARLGL
jgi:hypothetical protein